jgi:cobalt-zinc-cadmium efflux system protein
MSVSAAHHHHQSPGHGPPPVLAALAITLAYSLVEVAGGLWTGSLALLSDAGHMFSDALALGLAAAAARLARRPAGHRHTYGWARAEVIGALVNCLLLLGIIVALVVEAVFRLHHLKPVAAPGMMLIAFIGLAVNGVVAWLMSRGEMTMNVRAALLHVIGDMVSSFAALLAGIVIYATGWLPIDPILSLAIAALILGSTVGLLRSTLHVLMEGVPPALELTAIGRELAALPGVASVHDLHVWSIAPGRIALSAHLDVDDLQRWPAILAAAGKLLHDRHGIGHITLQPEVRGGPDIRPSVIRMWPRGVKPRQ